MFVFLVTVLLCGSGSAIDRGRYFVLNYFIGIFFFFAVPVRIISRFVFIKVAKSQDIQSVHVKCFTLLGHMVAEFCYF